MKKLEFELSLKELGLNRKTFASATNTSLATVRGWGQDGRGPVPSWVESWLQLYQKNQEFKILTDIIKRNIHS